MLPHGEVPAAATFTTRRRWEGEPTWPEAREQARRLWVDEVADASRLAVLNAVNEGNADLAFRILERIEPALAPSTRKVNAEVDAPVVTGVLVVPAAITEQEWAKAAQRLRYDGETYPGPPALMLDE